ncbi:MAG: hypothetical protein ACUVYA_20060 [Planctomycetota bacterium]
MESKRTPRVTPETSGGSTARIVAYLSASVAPSVALSAVTYGAGYYVVAWYMPAWKTPHHLYLASIVAKPLSWHWGARGGFRAGRRADHGVGGRARDERSLDREPPEGPRIRDR